MTESDKAQFKKSSFLSAARPHQNDSAADFADPTVSFGQLSAIRGSGRQKAVLQMQRICGNRVVSRAIAAQKMPVQHAHATIQRIVIDGEDIPMSKLSDEQITRLLADPNLSEEDRNELIYIELMRSIGMPPDDTDETAMQEEKPETPGEKDAVQTITPEVRGTKRKAPDTVDSNSGPKRKKKKSARQREKEKAYKISQFQQKSPEAYTAIQDEIAQGNKVVTWALVTVDSSGLLLRCSNAQFEIHLHLNPDKTIKAGNIRILGADRGGGNFGIDLTNEQCTSYMNAVHVFGAVQYHQKVRQHLWTLDSDQPFPTIAIKSGERYSKIPSDSEMLLGGLNKLMAVYPHDV